MMTREAVRFGGYALLAIAFFVATSAHARTQQSILVGSWHFEDQVEAGGTVTAHITFSANGTFEGTVFRKHLATFTASGTWVIAGKWLHYTYLESDPPTVAVGTRDRDEVIELTVDVLRIRTSNGEERTYHRRQS